MTKREFDKLLQGSHIGTKGPGGGATRKAAELYFVKGVRPITECARRAGCHPNNAGRTIKQIKGIADNSGMELVTVLVPKEKKTDLEQYARQLKDEETAR